MGRGGQGTGGDPERQGCTAGGKGALPAATAELEATQQAREGVITLAAALQSRLVMAKAEQHWCSSPLVQCVGPHALRLRPGDGRF
jgi:hypothetical protein